MIALRCFKHRIHKVIWSNIVQRKRHDDEDITTLDAFVLYQTWIDDVGEICQNYMQVVLRLFKRLTGISKNDIVTIESRRRHLSKVNRNFKAGVFSHLFGDEENERGLYNAFSPVKQSEDAEVVDLTLEDILYMDRVNDLAFSVGGT